MLDSAEVAAWLSRALERRTKPAVPDDPAVIAERIRQLRARIQERGDDPYRGVRREPGFPNLWFGQVPNTGDGTGRVVTCSYWIIESTRTVRCDNFGVLGLPI